MPETHLSVHSAPVFRTARITGPVIPTSPESVVWRIEPEFSSNTDGPLGFLTIVPRPLSGHQLPLMITQDISSSVQAHEGADERSDSRPGKKQIDRHPMDLKNPTRVLSPSGFASLKSATAHLVNCVPSMIRVPKCLGEFRPSCPRPGPGSLYLAGPQILHTQHVKPAHSVAQLYPKCEWRKHSPASAVCRSYITRSFHSSALVPFHPSTPTASSAHINTISTRHLRHKHL